MKNNSQPTEDEVKKGQAVYSKLLLKIYDFYVVVISNSYFWKCPRRHLLQLFQDNITSNHLDVGVGTGYFLKNSNFPNKTRLVLMDLNQNSLDTAAENTKHLHPKIINHNVFDRLSSPIENFDSISMNYLLHCMPGTMEQKGIVFKNLASKLNPEGIIFGSTILNTANYGNFFAKKLMSIYNKKGIFSNHEDSVETIETQLKENFTSFKMCIIGHVCLFTAIK